MDEALVLAGLAVAILVLFWAIGFAVLQLAGNPNPLVGAMLATPFSLGAAFIFWRDRD